MSALRQATVQYLAWMTDKLSICLGSGEPRIIYWGDCDRPTFLSIVQERNFFDHPIRYFRLIEPKVSVEDKRMYFMFDANAMWVSIKKAIASVPPAIVNNLFTCVFFDLPIMFYLRQHLCILCAHVLAGDYIDSSALIKTVPANYCDPVVVLLSRSLATLTNGNLNQSGTSTTKLYMRHNDLIAIFSDKVDIVDGLPGFLSLYSCGYATLEPVDNPLELPCESDPTIADMIMTAKISVPVGGLFSPHLSNHMEIWHDQKKTY